jgi:hypothetical protein
MFGGPLDLPLLFDGSPRVGLGLYSLLPMGWVIAIEVAWVAVGYWIYRGARKPARPQSAPQSALITKGNS